MLLLESLESSQNILSNTSSPAASSSGMNSEPHVRLIMLMVWQSPIMLFSYSSVFFIAAMTLQFISPLFDYRKRAKLSDDDKVSFTLQVLKIDDLNVSGEVW